MARATPSAILVGPRVPADPTDAIKHEIRVETYRTEFSTFTRMGT